MGWPDEPNGRSPRAVASSRAQPVATATGGDRVKPGLPTSSYLVQKPTHVNVCFGSQMPKTGGSLPTGDLATITNWICEGAPNN